MITENEETVLAVLRRGGPKTTRQVADSTPFNVEQTCSQLNRMKRKGLVENITPQKREATWRALVQHDE